MNSMLFIVGMSAVLAMLATYCGERLKSRVSARPARSSTRDCSTASPSYCELQAIFSSDPFARVEGMNVAMIEVKCSHALAAKLGAIKAENVDHFRAMRESGQFMMVRDPETLDAMFWPLSTGLVIRPWPPK